MSRIHKVHNATITQVKGKTVRALVSVWDNVDFQGDRVIRGAFTRSLAKWEASGDKIPVLWSHDWSDPFAFLGEVTKATETPQGLVVECDLDKDTEFSKQVLKLLETRRVHQWSFAYDVVDERPGADMANELVALDIIEVGPCLSGANPYTDTLSRKSVQAMLAREAGTDTGWCGTTIPRKAVDDLRSRVAAEVEGFLDSVFDAAQMKETTMTRTNPELARYNAQLDDLVGVTPKPDDDLRRQIDELTKTATGNILPATAAVLMAAAGRLAQSGTRAQAAGLADAEATLMEASRILRTIASGGEGSVEEVIAACRPLLAEFRAVGQTIAAGNLEKDLLELEGGTRFEVGNEDRIEGSVGVTEGVVGSRDRYEPGPKSDADLIAEVERLSPEADRKPPGHFEQISRVATWVADEEEATA